MSSLTLPWHMKELPSSRNPEVAFGGGLQVSVLRIKGNCRNHSNPRIRALRGPTDSLPLLTRRTTDPAAEA